MATTILHKNVQQMADSVDLLSCCWCLEFQR